METLRQRTAMFEGMFNRRLRPLVRALWGSLELIDVCLCFIFIMLLTVFIILATVGSNQSVSDAERNLQQFYMHSQPSTHVEIRMERRRRDSEIVPPNNQELWIGGREDWKDFKERTSKKLI